MIPSAPSLQQRSSTDAGFSALEVLIALGVLALALAVFAPGFRGPAPQALLAGNARALLGLLVDARTAALLAGRPVTCEIDVDRRAVLIMPGVRRLELPSAVGVQVTVHDGGLTEGRRVRLEFHPDGSASAARIVLASGQRSAVITVDGMTGHVILDNGRP